MRLITHINLKVEPRASLRDTSVPRRCISTGDVHSVVYPEWYRVVYTPGYYTHHGREGGIYTRVPYPPW